MQYKRQHSHKSNGLKSLPSKLKQSKKSSNLTKLLKNRLYQAHSIYQNKGLDQQFLFQRKQNHLNTYFNRRKNKLIEITKQNKHIYKRITAQKSFYSSRQLNKSIDSNCSNSRQSSRKGTPKNSGSSTLVGIEFKINRLPQKQSTITIQSQSINKIDNNNLNKFATLFLGTNKENALKSRKTTSSKTSTGNIKLPPLNGDPMLHKIVQEMYQQKPNKNKRVLY